MNADADQPAQIGDSMIHNSILPTWSP